MSLYSIGPGASFAPDPTYPGLYLLTAGGESVSVPTGVHVVDFTDGCGVELHAVHRPLTPCVVTKIDGWFDGGEVRTAWVSRVTDGVFPDELWRGGRKLTLGVTEWLETEQEVERRAREISGVFRSGRAGDGELTVSGIVDELSAVSLALDGQPKVARFLRAGRIEWELPLLAPDPYLYGPVQATTAFTPGTGEGLVYPLFDDDAGNTTGVLEFGESAPPAATLVNTGNAVAYPTIEVVGDMRSGFDLALAGDQTTSGRWGVTYRGDVRPAAPVTVDMAGRVLVNDVDQSWALTRRDWGGVEPGGSVTVTISPAAGGAGTARLSLRPTYL